jgi:hypothetical protein
MTMRKRLVVSGAVAALAALHSLAVRPAGRTVFDQRLFTAALDQMRHGKGFYRAYVDGSAQMNVRVSQVRSVRLPTVFYVWRLVPDSALFALFLAVVLGVTTIALTYATRRALPVLAVALYLLHAGDIWTPSGGTTEEILLVELWAVPALAVALAASRRGRSALAAGATAIAALVRELAFPLLITGMIAARSRAGARRPWIIATAAFALGVGAHWLLASGVTVAHGSEARLVGTASFPRSVLAIVDWPLPGPYVLGTAAFVASVFWLRRTGELRQWLGLLVLPLAGLVVDRPYWGLVLVPFTVFWATEFVCDRGSQWLTSRSAP